LLLDTHAFLWFVLDDPHLSQAAMAAIQDRRNDAFVSPASHWEIAIKISLGRYRLQGDFAGFWEGGMRNSNFQELPVSVRHTARMISLPFHHKDPFDRLIAAQSLAEGLVLASADAAFEAYGVTRVW
jgi:PIN domain nuclease of toxin-antitoxin system